MTRSFPGMLFHTHASENRHELDAVGEARFVGQQCVQLHGGIGFTWEHDVQIFHKRQMHSQFLFGDGAWQRAQLAELL